MTIINIIARMNVIIILISLVLHIIIKTSYNTSSTSWTTRINSKPFINTLFNYPIIIIIINMLYIK